MKVRLHGTRGSYPTSNRENEYFGGATSCVELINGTERIILDAGTGIIALGSEEYYKNKEFNILLTHLHMDHIQGLGFFGHLFNPNNKINIYGPSTTYESLYSRLNRYLSPPLFPIPFRDVPGNIEIKEVLNTELIIGSFKITSNFIVHPGPTVGYRVENQGKVLTYIPDHEPIMGSMEMFDDDDWLSGFDLAKDADLLLHDAQYTSKEYSSKVGWGHSSMEHAAEFAHRTGAKHLLMTHHDPLHTDEIKKRDFGEFMDNHDYDFEIGLAVQGSEIQL
ncbi:MAG: MBL fold metallo-hydrolase [Bacteroidia bacterium]|nr:MBL fold metallo-hydrolase [Bacteroidia bacterium]